MIKSLFINRGVFIFLCGLVGKDIDFCTVAGICKEGGFIERNKNKNNLLN
jgi:hypothetical protein